MTIHVSIKEAKNRLSELGRLVEDGERVVVTNRGTPQFELTPPRRGGIDFDALDQWKEKNGLPQFLTGEMPADFDDPLPADFLITPIRYPDETNRE
jgi:prevent-host-death family protein